jgi:FtsH-binding integral membrane protein
VPVVLSLTACMLVAGHVAIYGPVREADEGAAAHLWQLLMIAQVPVMMFFAVKWLPRVPRAAFIILTLQVAADIIALVPVYFLHL